MELTTSLRLCRERDACEDQYRLLVETLGAEWGDDRPIPLLDLLDLDAAGPAWTAFSNALWVLLRAVPPEQTEARDRLAAAFSAQLLGFVPGPPAHWQACRKLRAYSMGEASQMEVQQAARDVWATWIAWAARDAWDTRSAWATRATWTAWGTRSAWATWAISILRWLLDEEAIKEPTQEGED